MSAGTDDSVVGRYGSGRTVRRVEDPALVQGQGQFTDDVAPEGLLHLAFVRSQQAHADIAGIDLAAARAMPGVVAIWTGDDLIAAGVKPMALAPAFKRPDGTPMTSAPKRALGQGRVRHVGEAVAMVVAQTRVQAKAAADAVVLDLRERPAVTDPIAALAPDAPRLCDAPDNVCAVAAHGDPAAVAEAFARAAHTVKLPIVNQRVAPVTMEPRTVLASHDGQRLTVRLSSQMPSGVRGGLVECLPGLTPEQVRVVVGDVGGGFGMKTGIYPEDIAVAFAAMQLQRPVKWRPDRLEDFLTAVHGRDVQGDAELALDAAGRVLALRVRSVANVGAYPGVVSVVIQALIGPWVSTSVYDIPLIDLQYTAVLTNSASTGAYRGAGRPEAIYIIERLMDAAARKSGIERSALRRRNLVQPSQMPYKNPMGQVYDSGNFESILDQGLALAQWADEAGWQARVAASRKAGKWRGRAVSTFLEWTSGNAFDERVTVELQPDGMIEIFSATQGMGQGIATSYVQLAVDAFGVPPERIRVVQGDTDRGNGFGSAGSRSLFTGGSAVVDASHKTIDKARELAGQALEVPVADLEYRAGRYTVAGTDVSIDLGELAARQPEKRVVVDATTTVSGPSWPNGCHCCEVEVDAATGVVTIDRYTSVNDIGRVVSPQIVQGQVEGGAVQGIGQALCEGIAYDDAGQLLSASFMDYALPRADGCIAFQTRFDTSVPCLTNPLGAKGVGELGTIGATPTVVNAVMDALASAGASEAARTALQMPLTAPKVWQALRG
ncbi:MAG: xanthine dehydrogenase family protein molybdopterin-binding subunit [Rubrivivax sp.]|nr:xanthine dehydrogenase family protein molybdopterin-binding subunit [Rubrivivax sp.]